MAISLKGFGGGDSGSGASVSGVSALPPAAAEVRLPPTGEPNPPAPYTVSFNGTLGTGSGWYNYTGRNTFPASLFTGLEGYTQIRLTLRALNATIGNVYVGTGVSDGSISYASSATQVTFNGGSNSQVYSGVQSYVTDYVSFILDPTKPLVVSVYFSSGGGAGFVTSSLPAGFASWQFPGDLTTNISPSMNNDGRIISVTSIEFA